MRASLRLGLAGLGVHGSRYANHLLAGDVAGATLVAVSRSQEAKGRAFADEHQLAFYADPADLVAAADIDAVVLVLPAALHPTLAIDALSHGKALLVEKPLATSMQEAQRVAREVERKRGFLMVGQTLRFDPLVQELKRQRDSIGTLQMISINQRFEPSPRAWLDQPENGGGLFLNTGVHGFDLMRHLTGWEPIDLFAHARKEVTQQTEDQFIATVRFGPNGRLGVLDNARSTRSRSGRIELIGSEGQLWGDHVHGNLEFVRESRREQRGPIPRVPTVPRTLQAFVDAVRGGTESPVDVHDGVASIAMLTAASRAAKEQRIVTIEEMQR